jgi:hypothetical protein
MKRKTSVLVIFIGTIVALAFHLVAIAAIDAPHNEANNISCGNCHGQGLLQSPFWGGVMSFDELCQYCHTASSCPLPEITGPQGMTHTDSNGDALAECRTCHDPHYQKQKNYKNTDASNLYLATGTITGCADNGDGTSTLTYSLITYKTGWDAAKIIGKTDTCRSAIIFPNVGKLGYNYPVTGINELDKEITVKGNATPLYQYIDSSTFAIMYGQFIKDSINDRAVKFFDKTGPNSYGDGDTIYDGICEVCHTLTDHYRNDGGGGDQNHSNVGGADGTNCISCHNHVDGLVHGGGSGTGCEACHGHEDGWLGGDYSGTTLSHSTHTENDDDDVKGPFMVCSNCHDTNNYPSFTDVQDISDTQVCDTCHSPGGSFNGLVSQGGSIGGKTNWTDGVYQVDGNLASNKEKWCAGCHDDAPAVVSGNTAPDICGDNSTYGFYLGAHGNGTYGVDHNSRSYNRGECVNCHASNNISATSSHGGQLFEENNEDCFKCHTDTSSYQTGGLVNRSYSYRAGGYADTLDDIQEAFSFTAPATSHNLGDILTFITGNWGYTSDSNPCAACHNPHIAIGDPANAPNSRKTSGTRGYSPVSRPSLHSKDTSVWGLWGDVATERTNTYASSLGGIYQAPNAASGYEPDGSSTQDGSNLADFNTVCTDCHDNTNDITSTPLGGTLEKFKWDIEKHGGGSATDDSFGTDVKTPYQETQLGNYVLTCTDCHEPHGSPNNYLVRKQVNNGEVTVTQYGAGSGPQGKLVKEWLYLCERCHHNLRSDSVHIHPLDVIGDSEADCITCHSPPGTFPNCKDCHFHGNNLIYGTPYKNNEQLF